MNSLPDEWLTKRADELARDGRLGTLDWHDKRRAEIAACFEAQERKTELPHGMPTNAAEWNRLLRRDPVQWREAGERYVRAARSAIDGGDAVWNLKAACSLLDRPPKDWGPPSVELLRWIKQVLLGDLVKHWQVWRDLELESAHHAIEWGHIKTILGYDDPLLVFTTTGGVMRLGKLAGGEKVPAEVHDTIREVEERIVQASPQHERTWMEFPS